MAAEPMQDSRAYRCDDDDLAIADSEECVGDRNEEMDELAKLAIKVGIEQTVKGKGIPMEESIRRINAKLGLS